VSDRSNSPNCPECGRPMVLRRASRGPHAGQQFWGCSQYPKCRATLPVESSRTQEPVSGPPNALDVTLTLRDFPTPFDCFPRQRETQCTFFQSCALPAEFVERIHEWDVDRTLVRALAQWRLDYPFPYEGGISSEWRSVLAVAESLLTRGATPFCSPALERGLGKRAKVPEDRDVLIQGLRCVALSPSSGLLYLNHESPEERQFYELVFPRVRTWYITPQVSLASLSTALDPSRHERGDFLFTHPDQAPILVEIDGLQHKNSRDSDAARDIALTNAGVRVVRVPASVVRAGGGPELRHLEDLLATSDVNPIPENDLSRTVRLCKFYHQVQIALLEAIRGGWLRLGTPWSVGIVLPATLANDEQARSLVSLAVEDLADLIARIAKLHGLPVEPAKRRVVFVGEDTRKDVDVLVGPADGSADRVLPRVAARFLVSDACFPREILARSLAATPVRCPSPQREDARWFLQYLFRKEDFWEGQWETIDRTLRGLDSVVLLPTGAGKSIAFQLAALLLPGRCIVVDPILSLIDDQIDNLARVGIDRCIGISHQLSTQERESALQVFQSGHYLFCYIAPERFQSIPFREALRGLTTNTPISLIAIDEAHCVSEWGHDFRTAYLNLGRITRDYCASQGTIPPLVALTGTASKIVLKDVQRELGITSFDALITPKTFDRPELKYSILTCRSSEKTQRVQGFLDRLPTDFAIDRAQFFRPAGRRTHAGLVFCPHVNGPYGVSDQAKALSDYLKVRVEAYSGGPPNDQPAESWEQQKRKVAREFKRNRISILACTKAFGMGIDKPNIRYTVHIGLPGSIESFYQEAGRAGRDRKRAECAIVLSNDDPRRSQRLLSPATPLDEIQKAVRDTHWEDSDDITRALWFHVNAFRGVEVEVNDVEAMLRLLGDPATHHQVRVSWQGHWWSSHRSKYEDPRQRPEKALHRLVVLGVVADYTIDYSSQEFCVTVAGATPEDIAASFGRYVSAYQWRLGQQAEREALELREKSDSFHVFVLDVARRLIEFIYQHVEMARRRALNEMLQAASTARTGEDLRRRILDYLEQSEWDERLEAVRRSRRGGVDALGPLLEDLVTPNDAAALRAATGRTLASYPDVPGLLLLRAVSEALCSDANSDVVQQNVEAALQFATAKFALGKEELAAAFAQAIVRAGDKPEAADLILAPCLAAADRDFVRALLAHLPETLAAIPARWLLDTLVQKCATALLPTRRG